MMNDNENFFLSKFSVPIVAIVTTIVIFGSVMVFSSSYIYSKELHGSAQYFIIKQLIFIAIGTMLAYIVSKTKFTFWLKFGNIIHGFAIFLLLLTMFPSVGVSVNGASRWVGLGGINFQPSELIKVTLLFSAIPFFDRYSETTTRDKIVQFLLIVFPFLILIRQPDFGTFSICLLLLGLSCFLSSFPRKFFYSLFGIGSAVGVLVLFMQPYRVARVMTFLDPWKNSKTSGFQIIQSYLALASGKITGKGLGNSNEKLFYLPEAHNDFILSVIGEELGFVGVVIVIALYALFLFFGIKAAFAVKNRLGKLLIASLTFAIVTQALLNMGVVMGLLPTKGLNLPFVSYGGSSMIVNLFIVGIIISTLRTCSRSGQC